MRAVTTIKQRKKLKQTLNMAAMSTYPRLPFRPVPLTLTFRKPTHPPPIPIVRSPFSIPSPSSPSFPSSSNNKMPLSSLLSPLPVLTPFPNPPSSSSLSTLPPTPSLSPCPPPRQFRDEREHWDQGPWKTERQRQQQRQPHRQRPYAPHMVQQKTTQIPFKIGLQSTGGSLRKRRVKQSIITPFKPLISPRSLISKKNPSAAVVTAAAAVAAAAMFALPPQEDEIDLEALTYYPPVYTSDKETGTGGGVGGPESGYGSKPERRRTKLRLQKKKRDRNHYQLQQKQQRASHYSDLEDSNKSRSVLSRDDDGLSFVKRNFSSTGNEQTRKSSNREGGNSLSRPNSAPLPTRRPRSSSNGLPMPLKKRFMMKDSLL